MTQESIKQGLTRSVIYAVLIAFGVWLVYGQLKATKQEVLVKATLHTLQTGLQGYYAEKENYPKMSPAPAASIAEILVALGYLEQAPLNPYTRKPYTVEDAELDKIEYEAGEEFLSFELRAKYPDSDEVWLRLETDSRESAK